MATFAFKIAPRLTDLCESPSLLLAEGAGQDASGWYFAPLLVIGLLYYVMVLRPDQRNRTEQVAQLDKLKQNDRVVTAGGIHGVVVKAATGDPEVILRIDETNNTKIHIQRSSISRIVTDKDKDKTKDSQES